MSNKGCTLIEQSNFSNICYDSKMFLQAPQVKTSNDRRSFLNFSLNWSCRHWLRVLHVTFKDISNPLRTIMTRSRYQHPHFAQVYKLCSHKKGLTLHMHQDSILGSCHNALRFTYWDTLFRP